MDEEKFPAELIKDDPGKRDEKLFESLFSRVMNMSVSEKVKLATFGNKEARNILIRDSNRLVVQAVINSPKVTDDEVAGYASNPNLPKEGLVMIASKKEFIKNYKVKLSLVCNAKTPPPTALKLLPHLRERDMRNLSKSKNVPGLISRTALKILGQKGRV